MTENHAAVSLIPLFFLRGRHDFPATAAQDAIQNATHFAHGFLPLFDDADAFFHGPRRVVT